VSSISWSKWRAHWQKHTNAGLTHRDIKPGNILVVDRGGISDLVKVLDFGLVKDVRGGAAAEPTLTNADSITGTPHYMAPETITAPDSVDARTDIYAPGAVGYWLLTGTHVFHGNTVMEVLAHHLHSAPERPSVRLDVAVERDLEKVLLGCLANRPDDRPGSAHARAPNCSHVPLHAGGPTIAPRKGGRRIAINYVQRSGDEGERRGRVPPHRDSNSGLTLVPRRRRLPASHSRHCRRRCPLAVRNWTAHVQQPRSALVRDRRARHDGTRLDDTASGWFFAAIHRECATPDNDPGQVPG
jgi:serine/threonine protein kinase